MVLDEKDQDSTQSVSDDAPLEDTNMPALPDNCVVILAANIEL